MYTKPSGTNKIVGAPTPLMRRWDVPFIFAIAVSLAAHLLMIPAAKHIHVTGGSGYGSGAGRMVEVTISLVGPDEKKGTEDEMPNAPAAKPQPPVAAAALPPALPKPIVKPPDPAVDAELEMGEANGKGKGSNAAKGDQPLIARQADEEQGFLSRDPVGTGHVGDLPSDWTGPRGEGGVGGQRGSPAVTLTPAAIEPIKPPDMAEASKQKPDPVATDPQPPRAPELKVAEGPEPTVPLVLEKPDVVAPQVAAPLPSQTASKGAAPADLSKKPLDEILPAGPLARRADGDMGPLIVMPREGPLTLPQHATSTAPPTPGADVRRSAVIIGPQLPPEVIPQITLLQAPKIDDAKIGPKSQDVARPKADPADKPTKPTPPTQVATAVSQPQQVPPRPSTGDGRAPGPDRPAADPAQESDSESDAFQKTASADLFQDGKLEVRKGRKVKTTRPHILLGGQVSLIAMGQATVVLKISIDETGKVTGADILQSSGSNDVDQPCRVAVYDWWFEPTRNKAGRPVPDVIVFTIRFR
ncbi:MAG: TonB family protein [Phycisphaerales bacterium]|nr:TonB family protein [Phycisphaerales bacterium]